jgi:hypothetical protein
MTDEVHQSIREEYAEAFASGRSPRFARANLATWAYVADELVQGGELELAAYAVRGLREAWPDFAWAKTIVDLFEVMPPDEPGVPRFGDDFPKPVQVVRREGASAAFLVFCGAKHRIGMPLSMFHRWLARLPVSLIYLRDLTGLCYLGGIPELGADLSTTIAALGALVRDLGARRIVCYGNSAGGYGALRYGIDLAADAVICMGGLANLSVPFNRHLHYANTALRAEATFPGAQLDLRELYRSAESPPRAWLAYGERNWDDRIHSEHMAGLDGVTLEPVAGYKGHNSALELIRAGRFDDLLEEAVGA